MIEAICCCCQRQPTAEIVHIHTKYFTMYIIIIIVCNAFCVMLDRLIFIFTISICDTLQGKSEIKYMNLFRLHLTFALERNIKR